MTKKSLSPTNFSGCSRERLANTVGNCIWMAYSFKVVMACFVTICFSAPHFVANAASTVWLKHSELFPFHMVTNVNTLCLSEDVEHYTAVHMHNKGDPGATRAKLAECVRARKDAAKEPLTRALRYLETKSGATKALKEYYLSWRAYADLLPDRYVKGALDREREFREAQLMEARKLDALELEIELGN